MASSLLTADISIREAAAEVCRLKNALENAEKVLQNAIAIRQRACVAFSSADRSAGYVSSATRLTIEECYDWPALMKRAKVGTGEQGRSAVAADASLLRLLRWAVQLYNQKGDVSGIWAAFVFGKQDSKLLVHQQGKPLPPELLAEFLFHAPGVSAKRIAECIGAQDGGDVLRAFLRRLPLRQVPIDEVVRFYSFSLVLMAAPPRFTTTVGQYHLSLPPKAGPAYFAMSDSASPGDTANRSVNVLEALAYEYLRQQQPVVADNCNHLIQKDITKASPSVSLVLGTDAPVESPKRLAGAVYRIFYGLIILQTNLHNPSVPAALRLTKDAFVSMMREASAQLAREQDDFNEAALQALHANPEKTYEYGARSSEFSLRPVLNDSQYGFANSHKAMRSLEVLICGITEIQIRQLYKNVKAQPLSVNSSNVASVGADRIFTSYTVAEGWLSEKKYNCGDEIGLPKLERQWKRRFFRLTDGMLYFYDSESLPSQSLKSNQRIAAKRLERNRDRCIRPQGVFFLRDCDISPGDDEVSILINSLDNSGIEVADKLRFRRSPLKLRAGCAQERDAWLSSLRSEVMDSSMAAAQMHSRVIQNREEINQSWNNIVQPAEVTKSATPDGAPSKISKSLHCGSTIFSNPAALTHPRIEVSAMSHPVQSQCLSDAKSCSLAQVHTVLGEEQHRIDML